MLAANNNYYKLLDSRLKSNIDDIVAGLNFQTVAINNANFEYCDCEEDAFKDIFTLIGENIQNVDISVLRKNNSLENFGPFNINEKYEYLIYNGNNDISVHTVGLESNSTINLEKNVYSIEETDQQFTISGMDSGEYILIFDILT
jgi:hypothetical protein